MLEGSDKPDVIVAALPIDLIMRMVNDLDETGEEEGSDDDPIDFRDLLKAQTLHLQRPTQLVWPTLWDDPVRIPRKLRKTMRRVQDPATRAWNVLNAMFYKAGRAPWRLPRPEEQLKTTYVGIGFYRDLTRISHTIFARSKSFARRLDSRFRNVLARGAGGRERSWDSIGAAGWQQTIDLGGPGVMPRFLRVAAARVRPANRARLRQH